MVLLLSRHAAIPLQDNAGRHAIVAEQILDRSKGKVPQPPMTDPLNAGDFS
jgi:hypothetical protein